MHKQSDWLSEPTGLVDDVGQERHTLLSKDPAAGGVLVEYVFFTHPVHAVPVQYRPASHTQSLEASDPAGLVDEAGQDRHTLLSEAPDAAGVLGEYVFAAQLVQAVPSQYRPALHTQSLEASDPAGLVDEAGQARHTELSDRPLAGGVEAE